MTAADLIADLAQLGIQLEAHGDRLRFWPRSAVTPDLAQRMKARKRQLLFLLRSDAPDTDTTTTSRPDLGTCPTCDTRLVEKLTFDHFLNLECSRCDRCFGCRPSTKEVAARFAPQKTAKKSPLTLGESVVEHAKDEPTPCLECGSLELWQTAAGDMFGRTPGNYRCLRCDPPTSAQRLRKRAARLKTDRTDSSRMNARGGP